MKSLSSYIYFCITFFSLPSLLFCFISCNPSTSDPSRETKKPKTVVIQSEIKSNMTRISFQDLNKTFSADGKRQVSAIPLLPYPVEHNLTSPNDWRGFSSTTIKYSGFTQLSFWGCGGLAGRIHLVLYGEWLHGGLNHSRQGHRKATRSRSPKTKIPPWC